MKWYIEALRTPTKWPKRMSRRTRDPQDDGHGKQADSLYTRGGFWGGHRWCAPPLFCVEIGCPTLCGCLRQKESTKLHELALKIKFFFASEGHIPIRHPVSPQVAKYCQFFIWVRPLLKILDPPLYTAIYTSGYLYLQVTAANTVHAYLDTHMLDFRENVRDTPWQQYLRKFNNFRDWLVKW